MAPRSATLPPLASGGGRYEPNESPSYLSCSKCIESTTHTRKTFLDFHIGVYQPWYSVLFGNTCYLIHSNKDQIQFTYLIKDSIIMDVIIAQKSLIW